MSWLYEQGRERAKSNQLWRTTPPGTEPGEEIPIRGGIQLRSASKPAADMAAPSPGR
jgi:hypothetical protein